MQKHSAVFIIALVAVVAISGEARRSGTGTRSSTGVVVVTGPEIDPIALANFIIDTITQFIQDILAAIFNCSTPCGIDGSTPNVQLCLLCVNVNFPELTIPPLPAGAG